MDKIFVTLTAAQQVICDACGRPSCPRLWGCGCDRIDRLIAISAADVVEVVRCKDCEYYNRIAGMCEHFDIDMYINDYCSDGSSRDDNG